MLHRFKCSQQPHLEYNIVLKEIYDDWCSKKQSRAVFVAYHARYFTPYLSSFSFAPYPSFLTLFCGVSVIRHAAARTTNLHHH
jgi:hypothetical protein